MDRGRRAAYAGVALVLAAALAILLLAPSRDEGAVAPEAAPTAIASPMPPGAPTTAYDGRIMPGGSALWLEGRHVFVVRQGDSDLRVSVAITDARAAGADAPAVNTTPWSVVLRDPDGIEAARCAQERCAWTFATPMAGRWRFIVPGERAEHAADLRASIVRAALAPPEELVYAEARSLDLAAATASWADAFMIADGQDRFVAAVGFGGGAFPACDTASYVDLVAPDGAQVARFLGEYRQENAEPGRWTMVYTAGPCTGATGSVRAG